VTAPRRYSVADAVDAARRLILPGTKEEDRMGTRTAIAAGEAASPETSGAPDVRPWNLRREESK